MFWLAFVCLGDPGDLAVRPVFMNFTSHTTSSPLPSPSTHNSLTSLYLRIQGGHLHTICQLSDLFLSLLFLEKVMEASSALYFWDHHTKIQAHRSTGTALVYS